MKEKVTTTVLLKHIQAMKVDLQQQIADLDKKLTGQIGGLDGRVTRLEKNMQKGFEDARLHRQALQEDLDATIRMLAKHDRKLARL